MHNKLPININDLLLQRTIESERIEYKADWNPESVMHTLCAFANDFHNLGSGYIVIGVAEDNGRPILPSPPLMRLTVKRFWYYGRLQGKCDRIRPKFTMSKVLATGHITSVNIAVRCLPKGKMSKNY